MLHALEMIVVGLGLLLFGVWIFGVATEFLTGVRIEWGFLLWGLRHRKEIEEASICQCHKPGAEWTPAGNPSTGNVTMLVCWYCGRVASPAEFHEIMKERKRAALTSSTSTPF